MTTQMRLLPLLLAEVLVFHGGSTAFAQESWVGESVIHTKPSNEIEISNLVDGVQVSFTFSGILPIKVRDEP